MISINEKEKIWAEKYRPQTVDDLIFPEEYKVKFREWIEAGEIPSIGIFGNIAGTGKSSLLNVLITQLNTDTLWINGSKENGIDVMRNKIGNFADTMSISGNHKFVCIDEADYLTVQAQATLRSDIELYSQQTRFAFTGNYPDRIIPPLLSRLQKYNLDEIYSQYKKELIVQIFKRLMAILKAENVEADQKIVSDVIKGYYPSTRDMIMHLEQHTVDGVLTEGNINKTDEMFDELVQAMRGRKFKVVRDVITDILVPEMAYTFFLKNLDLFELQSQPTVIIALADYQDFSSKAKNKTIPLLAFVTKMIMDPDVKFSK